ncbi:uncharacterized protein OCT59_010554 [Rhizophagus irregularis]|uniref:uncharacterized protein n=1 Tax=Rhizophagus irregularis TaxID=588596 RepID=UPI00332D0EA1|nr:hypothetical protein OCT59_010554 [Rhizophagus irregularis]
MSLNRRACGAHQSEFSRKEINHHLKPRPDWDPGFTNSKSSHANFLYDLWQHRWKNEIFSNRLGIQYNVCFATNSSNFVQKLLLDLVDYTFNIPHHSLDNPSITPIIRSQPSTSYRPSGTNTIPHYMDAEEITAFGDYLMPLGKPTLFITVITL